MNKRVDYETARALMLLGMPQGVVDDNGIKQIGEPFYVTIYKTNTIHKYIPQLNLWYIKTHDAICYAATKEEACKWLLNQIKELED